MNNVADYALCTSESASSYLGAVSVGAFLGALVALPVAVDLLLVVRAPASVDPRTRTAAMIGRGRVSRGWEDDLLELVSAKIPPRVRENLAACAGDGVVLRGPFFISLRVPPETWFSIGAPGTHADTFHRRTHIYSRVIVAGACVHLLVHAAVGDAFLEWNRQKTNSETVRERSH